MKPQLKIITEIRLTGNDRNSKQWVLGCIRLLSITITQHLQLNYVSRKEVCF